MSRINTGLFSIKPLRYEYLLFAFKYSNLHKEDFLGKPYLPISIKSGS